MIFTSTNLSDAVIIDLDRKQDERGFFARSWCREEFAANGLNPNLVQCNVSFNKRAGTLRGMHYQIRPNEEAKLVRCTAGALHDVIVDLRPRPLPTFVTLPLNSRPKIGERCIFRKGSLTASSLWQTTRRFSTRCRLLMYRMPSVERVITTRYLESDGRSRLR